MEEKEKAPVTAAPEDGQVSTSSNGDVQDAVRVSKRLKQLAPAKKEAKKPRRAAGSAVPAARVPAAGRKRAAKRKRAADEEDDASEMDAVRALMGMGAMNFGAPASPVKSKARAAAVPELPFVWLCKGKRSERRRKTESTGTSGDAPTPPTSSQQGKPALAAPAKCEDGCQSDNERQHKSPSVLRFNSSDSSTDFAVPDSRAQSPSSPLPPLAGDACITILAKLESIEVPAPSLQRPMRPIKKVPTSRKPKVEDKVNEAIDDKLHDGAVKQVGKNKSKPSRRQVTAVAVKLEGSSSETVSAASLRDLGVRAAEEEVNWSEQPHLALVCVKDETKNELALIKVTGHQKPGQRSGGKSKPVISETERESRRLRRVQANRESARQTIRRKQLHCEELALKAARLASEQDGLNQEYQYKVKELQQLCDLNRRLKEDLAVRTGNNEPILATPDAVRMPMPPNCITPFQFPHMFPPPMNPYLWSAFAAAMAQEAVKNMVHPHILSAAASAPVPTSRAPECPAVSGPSDQQAPLPGQPVQVRSMKSGDNVSSAAVGLERGHSDGAAAGKVCRPSLLPQLEGRDVATRSSDFQGKASGTPSFMGFPSLPTSSFPVGLPGMTMPPGYDGVGGGQTSAMGTTLPFAFPPGHHGNRAGGLVRPQVAGKVMGIGGSSHGPQFFFDSSHQQVMPGITSAKAAGAAAAAAAARKRRKELTRSKSVLRQQLARGNSAEVAVPATIP